MTEGRRGERGNIVVTISVLGTAITVVALSAFLHAAGAERESSEESLARLRAYWAGMGTMSYMLSRVRATTACVCDFDSSTCSILYQSCDRDEDRIMTLEVIYGELAADQHWTYDSVSSDYFFDTQLAVENDEANKGPNNAHLKMTVTYAGAGSPHPVLSSLVPRLRPLQMRFCLGLDSPTKNCENPDKNMNSQQQGSGLSAIKTVRRQ